jgi:predicted lactoylglutathione lyase
VDAMLFVNLPVKDLQRSVNFFTALGFTFNPDFTDENATCMVVGERSFVMLIVEPFFTRFTTKPVADASTHTEVIMTVSADRREQVDELVQTALAHGGSPAGDPVEEDQMYGRSFHDPDGHVWEFRWMDVPVGAPA